MGPYVSEIYYNYVNTVYTGNRSNINTTVYYIYLNTRYIRVH